MMGSKTGLLMVGAALAASVLAAVAFAQEGGPQVTAMVRVKPNEAGTPSRPRGIEIDARGIVVPAGAIVTVGAVVPAETALPVATAIPVARSFDVWLPKGWLYNGVEHPSCTLAKLSAGGPAACPPESIMGRGQVGHPDDPNDISPSARVTFINGGATKMYFWVVMQNPARVQVAVPGTLTKVNSPRWSYRLHADNPSRLQIVSGIPITLNSFSASFGRGDWIATTSCPRDYRWRYRLRMTSTSGQVLDTDGSVSCRR